MNKIKIIFSKHSKFNLFSSAIMFALNSPYSHVAIQLEDKETHQKIIYQASSLFINEVCLDKFLEESTIIQEKEFDISDDAYLRIKKCCVENLGRAYDLLGVIGFGIQILLGSVGIQINNILADSTKMWCSEFCTLVIEAGLQKEIANEESVSPKDLDSIVQNLPIYWE